MDPKYLFLGDDNGTVYAMPLVEESVDYVLIVRLVIVYSSIMFAMSTLSKLLVCLCTFNNEDKQRIASLYDEVEQLKEAVDALNTDNDSLEHEVRELKVENGNLTADRDANERLIKKLQDEIKKLDHKVGVLEADAFQYEIELSEFYNAARRKRVLTPSTPPPVIRKRHRSESAESL